MLKRTVTSLSIKMARVKSAILMAHEQVNGLHTGSAETPSPDGVASHPSLAPASLTSVC